MVPATTDDSKRQSCANRNTFQRGVPQSTGRKAHDDDRSTWTHELREARERFGGIHVVQRGHGYDGIEGARFERGGEYVTVNSVDSRDPVSGTRSLEYSSIDIERHHAGHADGSKLRCQNPVTTSDVKNV
jgi:hypothetical protein